VHTLYRLLLLFNPLNAELNPIYHLLTLLEAHPIFHFSRIRVNVVYTVYRLLLLFNVMCTHCIVCYCYLMSCVHILSFVIMLPT